MQWINDTYTTILISYLDQFIRSKKIKGGRAAVINQVKEKIEEAARTEDANIPDNLYKVNLKLLKIYINLISYIENSDLVSQ
jgi:hypothetical protein